MNRSGVIMGFLSDQSAGAVRVPFLGHDCSTTTAPAIFALRYHCILITGICYRVGLARWRIEAGADIPTHENGQARAAAAIMGDVNRAFEAAVRRDPANWFWVHRRWKPAPPEARLSPASASVSPVSGFPVPQDPGVSQKADPGQ
jgi:KDO2-lipid IV(A) lauroyltransferase